MLDAYEIMPDHFHGIIMISNPSEEAKVSSLPEAVRQFKTFSAKRINKLRNTKGVPVWQRNYHEHILRSEELDIFRKYIKANPTNKETYWNEILANNPWLKEMYDFDSDER
jgi:putative transposase